MSYSPAGLVAPRRVRTVLDVFSSECVGPELSNGNLTVPVSNNWPLAANGALFVPLSIAEPTTVFKGWVRNGAAVAGNLDFGLYRPDGTRIVSSGSIAQATIDVHQELDIADTFLAPGQYYMALASNTSGTTQKVFTAVATIAGQYRALGVYQMLSAFPLPATATFAVYGAVQLPYFGLLCRTLL